MQALSATQKPLHLSRCGGVAVAGKPLSSTQGYTDATRPAFKAPTCLAAGRPPVQCPQPAWAACSCTCWRRAQGQAAATWGPGQAAGSPCRHSRDGATRLHKEHSLDTAVSSLWAGATCRHVHMLLVACAIGRMQLQRLLCAVSSEVQCCCRVRAHPLRTHWWMACGA